MTTTAVLHHVPGVRIPAEKKSCLTCPSFVDTGSQTSNFGMSFGTPVCGKRMIPLMVPDASAEVKTNQLLYHAEACGLHGEPWLGFTETAISDKYELNVAIGKSVNVNLDENGDPHPTRKRALTCHGCVNFIPAPAVFDQSGFNASMCAAKGSLLMDDRLAAYTTGCDFNEAVIVGTSVRADVGDVRFFREHSRKFGLVDPTAALRKSRETDPTQWKTEAPVTDSDRANGIRAWRKIIDPNRHGPDIFLPIYQTEYFGEDQHLIPKVDGDDRPDLYTDYGGYIYQVALAWRIVRMTPALWGMPGVGKTEIMRHMSWLMNAPYTRISFTGASEFDDVFGKMMYHPEKGTYFHLGRFTSRVVNPGVILLDEPNTASDLIWQSIRPITDNAKQLVIDAGDDPRVYKMHPNAFIALAMNPNWDIRNVGTNPIGDADARRLLHVNVGLPPEDVEMDIINRHCQALDGGQLAVDDLKKLIRVGADIRQLSDNATLNITWGLANSIKVARLLRYLPADRAFGMAVLDYLDPEARNLVNESIQSIFS